MSKELEALRDIVTSSVNKVLDVCSSAGKPFPSLDEPLHPSEFSPDGIRNHPEVAENINLAVAASMQLVATLQSPVVNLWNSAFRVSVTINPAGRF